MMMVASVGSIAQLSDSATFGLGAITVYLIPAVLFLLPVGLVSAELATSHEGGIFVWVREAFGDRTGFQATWFVFMNSVTLYPSLLSFGAAALATAFGRPDLAGNGLYMGAVVLVGFWLATFVVSKGMQTTAGLSNLGVGLGTIVPAFALIFFMCAWLIDSKPSATPLDLSAVTPPFDGLSSIALVVGTFVAFAGLEVNAVHIKHLKGRPRSYFKAVLLGGAAGLRDVHARVDRDLGGRARRHPRAHLGRLAGLHGVRRRVRLPGPLQPVVGAAGAGRGGRVDRLDRRPEPQHVAGRSRRATCRPGSRRSTGTTCRCRSCSSRGSS